MTLANFTEALPIWTAAGVKPPDSIISGGWQASQKPPADYFNWFFSRTHAALREIQTKAALDADLTVHKSSKSNPHAVTAAQVGLGNVLNQKQATKVEFDSHNGDSVRHITNVERATWNGAAAAVPDLQSHTTNKSNPHEVTKEQVSLGNVLNYGIATTAEAQAGTASTKYMTPILVSEAIKVLQAIKSVNGKTGTVVLSKSDVGLAQVDNLKQATKVEFDAHKDSKVNPHGVTAAQTGAYTKAEADAKVSAAKSEVIAGNVASAAKMQTGRKIAGVTFDGTVDIAIPAANVGAYTKVEADSKDAAILTNAKAHTDAHAARKDNPHGVTPAQIGVHTKSESDAKYVALAGAQEITGIKNYADGLQIGGKKVVAVDDLVTTIFEGDLFYGKTVTLDHSIGNFKTLRITGTFSGNYEVKTIYTRDRINNDGWVYVLRTTNIEDVTSGTNNYWLNECDLKFTTLNTATINRSKTIAKTGTVIENDASFHIYRIDGCLI